MMTSRRSMAPEPALVRSSAYALVMTCLRGPWPILAGQILGSSRTGQDIPSTEFHQRTWRMSRLDRAHRLRVVADRRGLLRPPLLGPRRPEYYSPAERASRTDESAAPSRKSGGKPRMPPATRVPARTNADDVDIEGSKMHVGFVQATAGRGNAHAASRGIAGRLHRSAARGEGPRPAPEDAGSASRGSSSGRPASRRSSGTAPRGRSATAWG